MVVSITVLFKELRWSYLVVRLWLHRVDEVGELHCVLDEEDGNVIPHNIPVTLLCVELDGEPSDIAYSVSAATAALDCGEADENRRLARGISEHWSEGDVLRALVEPESTKGARPSGVDHTLGDSLVVKTVDLRPSLETMCVAGKNIPSLDQKHPLEALVQSYPR